MSTKENKKTKTTKEEVVKNYTIEKLENDCVKFTFTVTELDWTNAIVEAYNKTKNKYKIEGFRPGHVPFNVIKNRYGVGVFFDDALDIILPKYYFDALDVEKELEVVDQPDVEISSIDEKSLVFTAKVQLKPEVKLGAYTGLEFKKKAVKVSAAEVKAEVDKAIEQAGSWEPVEDRACQNGDQVIIDYSGSVDGVKFAGGTAEKQNLQLGSGQFIPGFEEQVVGMKIGESKDITVKFPEEYGAKELAGKEAVFAITLHEVTEKKTPAYDDEFVKDVSEFNTVKEYEADIKKNLTEKKEKDSEAELENTIMETVSKNATVNVPECMVKRQAEEMVKEFEYGLMYRGMNKDDYYKYTNTTPEKLAETYKENAKKNVLYGLVLAAIKKEVTVPVADEEVNDYIAKMAADAKMSVEDYSKNINEEYKNYIRNDLATTKIFEYLKNNNTIK